MYSDDVRRWMATHHGVLSRREALRLGMTPRQITWSVAHERWEKLGRGVYRLAGVPPSAFGDLRAAVLLAGEGAAASHWSAAWLWGLTDGWEPASRTVTVPHARRGAPLDVRVMRTRIPFKPVVRNHVPCTEVVRTILDCSAEAVTPTEIDDLLDRALARRRVRLDQVTRALGDDRYGRHPGRRRLARRLVARGVSGSPAPSILESRMARLFVEHGLPAPKAEVQWGPQRRYRLDFAYPGIRLAIEVDGWASHFSPEQQRWDNRRSNALAGAGWTVLHYDWWEVTFEPERVAAEIAGVYEALSALRPA